MRCGIPIAGGRVAPRCTVADALMVMTVAGGEVISQDLHEVEISGLFDLLDALGRNRVDSLICGGIDRDTKEAVRSVVGEVVDNVSCTAEEIAAALESGSLAPGFRPRLHSGGRSGADVRRDPATIDCVLCRERVCLRGESCLAGLSVKASEAGGANARMLETAFDIGQEKERKLCRVAETVYFCLEMEYRRIGLAYCTELHDAARILTGVLRRFFEVAPVCCKVGGERNGAGACNPRAQAEVLNRRKTDFNLAVGLCIGADALFARASQAPVSTLFVKDRSLANNPIGALYSDYYLRESVTPAGHGGPAGGLAPTTALFKEES